MAGVNDLDNDKLLVVAIDFGTTFSGYAFAFNDTKREIKMNKNWGDLIGCQAYKAPTSVLIDSSEKFVSFGFEAEWDFSNSGGQSDDGKVEAQHLFRNFKMALHREITDRKQIANSKISSTTGKRLPAVDVFAMVIKYMKDHVLDEIQSRIESTLEEYLIKWVLTVPAIWTDEAKHLMREASKKAGIIDDVTSPHLIIALEPEAASIYCRESDSFDSVPLSPGQKYLVIDCGGGTADITAHEVTSGRTLREIYPPCGGPWGGTYVDKQFNLLLDRIFGKEVMQRFREQYPQNWFDVSQKFELQKKAVKTTGSRGISVALPSSFTELMKENTERSLRDVIEARADLGISWQNGSLYIKPQTALGLFDKVITSLTNKLKEIKKHEQLTELNYVFLVGGFSQCEPLQKAIQGIFSSIDQCKIILPFEGQLAIMRGAVLFAFQPSKICSRIAQATYGFEISKKFDKKEHDPRYIATMQGQDMCSGLFSAIIQKGEVMDIGIVKTHKLLTNNESKAEGHTILYLYRSHKSDVKYVNFKDCKKIAELKIEHDFVQFQQNFINIEIHCGSTELMFKAKDSRRNEWFETTVTYY